MDTKYADKLTALLMALKATGKQFPPPTVKEFHGGWGLHFFHGTDGLSVVCHGGSYGLETAEITGTTEKWEFSDPNPCTQVKGHRDVEEVAADIVRLYFPPLLGQ